MITAWPSISTSNSGRQIYATTASKPFVLPQENPEFYDTFIKNYNIPELITGEVTVSPLDIRDKVLEEAIPAKIDASVDKFT